MSEISSRPRVTAVRIPPITDYAVDGATTPTLDGHDSVLTPCDGVFMANQNNQHRALASLTTACSAASSAVGFTDIEVQPKGDSELRVIAFNLAGQALVSEIHVGADGASLATEVFGVRDHSCGRILDTFDAAIESQGVRSVAPQRKYTGGVAELISTKDLLRRFSQALKPKADASSSMVETTRRRAGRSAALTRVQK